MNKKDSKKRQESQRSFHSASSSPSSESPTRVKNTKKSHKPRGKSSPQDSLPSFETNIASPTSVRHLSSSQASMNTDSLEEASSPASEENKIIASIFCIHFGIFVVSLAGILITLYQDTVKFLVSGRRIFYLCSGVLMGISYILMFVRQVFRRKLPVLQRRTVVWDMLILSLMAVVQAIFLAIMSAYHDTELMLFAAISVMTAYWMVSLVTFLRESPIIGWRMYVIGASVLGGIFAIQAFLMCFRAYCEFIGDIALATVLATIITLHTIYASIMILKIKWRTMNPKTKTNAPILVYIFIPLVVLHAIEKRFKR